MIGTMIASIKKLLLFRLRFQRRKCQRDKLTRRKGTLLATCAHYRVGLAS